MVAVQFIMSMAVTVMAPIVPLFLPQLGVTDHSTIDLWAGILNSCNFLLSALLAPVWGSVADRRGRKLMVLRASGGICLVSGLMALVTSVWQLFALTLVMGVAGGFSSAAIALVAGQAPERRLGYALGWLSTAQMVGGLMGPVAGGALADALGSYRATFAWTAALAAIALVVAAALVQEPEWQERGRPARLRGRLRRLMRIGGLPALMTILLMTQFATRSVVPVVTLYVQSLTGPVPALATLAGFATSVTGVADVLASPFLGRRSDVLGYRRVLLICLGGAAITTLPMGLAGSYWVFVAERFAMGLFIGGILPTTNALIGRLVPADERGLVFGATATASLLGAFLGPLMGGTVAAALGLRAVFAMTAGLLLLTWLWAWRTAHDPKSAEFA
jgi:MFS transporter, DHA1 family, multidrug resistance protein